MTRTPVGTEPHTYAGLAVDDLRIIGTSYQGKEPFEYTADVLRNVLRAAAAGSAADLAPILTSRPFTAVTHDPGRPGAMAFGRDNLDGANRAMTDLDDGLAALAAVGFRVEPLNPTDPPGVAGLRADTSARAAVVVVGPLLVPARWAPPTDRIVLGEVWRHVIVDTDDAGGACTADAGSTTVCLDPVVGGYTAFDTDEFNRHGVRLQVVSAPDGPFDAGALARLCLRRGARWRVEAAGADRDARGLAAAADATDSLLTGGAVRRLRLSLAAYGLHALRAGAMLGWCGPLSTDALALADLLADTVTGVRAAQAALAVPSGSLAAALRQLANTAAAVGELYGRLDADPA